jgi:hypothetical protein
MPGRGGVPRARPSPLRSVERAGALAEFGRDVWTQLVPQLDPLQPAKARVPVPYPGERGGSCDPVDRSLLCRKIFSGKALAAFYAPVMAGLSDQARERILAIAVADHLDRVQMLLTEIADGNGGGPEGFSIDRERAEDLVQEGRLMRQTLAAQGETATTGFLDEVERFLIEAAHTPDNATAQEVGELRDRIESGSLLFKVRIVESNLRNEEQKL